MSVWQPDVAARGIDLPNLDLVIHADLPRTPDVLLHRSGRTGRAGRKGTAIIIVPENTYRKTQRLLQQAGIKAEWGKAPDADAIRARDDRRIMQNADLTAKSDETEITLQKKLAASFSAEQLALALIRQHRRDLAAPEELGDIGDMNIAGEARPYLWFSLSAGKAQDIHVRGLLSLLSAHGGVKNSDVGDIYLHHAESHVAIAESTANSFISQLKGGHLTEEITVTQINSPTIPKSRDKANRGARNPLLVNIVNINHLVGVLITERISLSPSVPDRKRINLTVKRNHLLRKSPLEKTHRTSLSR